MTVLDHEDPADPSAHEPKVTGAPDAIWLVYGDIERDSTHAECCASGEVLWCEDSQWPADVRYLREDLLHSQARELLTQVAGCHDDMLQRLRDERDLCAAEHATDIAHLLDDAATHLAVLRLDHQQLDRSQRLAQLQAAELDRLHQRVAELEAALTDPGQARPVHPYCSELRRAVERAVTAWSVTCAHLPVLEGCVMSEHMDALRQNLTQPPAAQVTWADRMQRKLTDLRQYQDAEAVAAITALAAERERWRAAAEYAAHQLEQARVWNGMDWHYNPLHPMHYRSALERLREVLRLNVRGKPPKVGLGE